MVKTGNRLTYRVFLVASGTLCLSYAFLFKPVTIESQGDFPAYLDLARQIFHLPGASDADLSHRSPLFSAIMGVFMVLFGDSSYLVPLMFLQYFLVFLSSLFIFKIVLSLTARKPAAFIAGMAGIFNLATVFFGYMILSETLALFLFTLTVWLLLKYFSNGERVLIVFTGVAAGLLILARFNMMALPAVILALMPAIYLLRKDKPAAGRLLTDLFLFAGAIAFVLNLWAFRNYLETDRYELIPSHHLGTRWAVPATISPSDRVTDEYVPVLSIFLATRERLLAVENDRVYRKSSLLENDFLSRINNRYRPPVSGYLMYRDSEQELLNFYKFDKTPQGIRDLNMKLKPFYSQIADQNKKELRRLRVYSLLYTFKHISPTLAGSEKLNLNRLPSPLLKAYKILFIAVIVMTYMGSVIHMVYLLMKRDRLTAGLHWFMVYGLIWYFPVINWYANVLGDANRFRYPADMLLAGLFVSYLFLLSGRKGVSQGVFSGNQITK